MNSKIFSRLYSHHLQFIITLFLILFQALHGSSQPDELYQACGNTFSCGNTITDIGYPFRGFDDPPYCGHPGLVLTCDDQRNITNINITGMTFRVLEIDETSRTMKIVRADLMDRGTNYSCPTEMANTTLDFNLFEYAAAYRNYTFLYGCDPELQIVESLQNRPCGINDSAFVVPGETGPGEACNASVVVPGPPGPAKAGELNLQEGFLIRWKIGSKECSDCTATGGRCGYNLETNQTTCHPPIGSNSVQSNVSAASIVGIVFGITGTIITIIIVYCLKRRYCVPLGPNLQQSNGDVENFLLQHGSLSLKRYKYSEIKKITKSFSDKLGRGGYGSVYKGILPDGSLVAVKVLIETTNSTNGEEFINEVASISRTSHVNVVNLLGFCFDKNNRALVYEFMSNKSLDKFISNNNNADSDQLELKTLYEIAVGVAKGLEYLHTGCNTRIIHFDIKPQNILLDEDLRPKISDFGLAKLCKKKQSILSTLGVGTRGTIGYIAPEVFSRNFGRVSHKSDVYSYGMMILEMAGARKVEELIDQALNQSSENYFPDKIYEHVVLDVTRKLDDFMNIEDIEDQRAKKKKMFWVGFWCIQTNPSDRPSMSKVVGMLEGNLQSIPIPPKPFLFCPDLSGNEISSSLSEYVETKNSDG